jgi:hypothetical protein
MIACTNLTVAQIEVATHIKRGSMWTVMFERFATDHVALVVHIYLLGGAALATAMVGFGIIWESGPLEVREIAHRLVIWGIIIETLCSVALFTFDEGLSGAQQAKIIALERRIAPRNLSPSQQKEIADSLRQFSDVQFIVQSYSIDVEGHRLQDQIEKMLVASGFRPLPRGSGLSSDPLIIGVKVLSNEAGDPLAAAVCAALKAKDIECTTAGPRVAGGLKTIAVWVGVKAIAEP